MHIAAYYAAEDEEKKKNDPKAGWVTRKIKVKRCPYEMEAERIKREAEARKARNQKKSQEKRVRIVWDLTLLFLAANARYGEDHDLSEVKEIHLVNTTTLFPVTCKCGHRWETNIHRYIRQRKGCWVCGHGERLSLTRLIRDGTEINNGTISYAEVTEEQASHEKNYIPLTCLVCGYWWNTCTVGSHLHGKRGCPSCSGRIPLTYEMVIDRIKATHGDDLDTSQITEEHIKGKDSNIPVRCNICEHSWSPRIHDITRKKYCSGCSGNVPWTVERLLKKGPLIHGEKYDYSQVKPEHINKGGRSKIPIFCTKCKKTFKQQISNHINGRNGCGSCHRSHGEAACEMVLRKMPDITNIDFQFYYADDKRRLKYDVSFKRKGKTYRIEFDGGQHFYFVKFFHKNFSKFKAQQGRDISKTINAVNHGDHMIRIDHTQEKKIKFHLEQAFKTDDMVYVSNIIKYKWLLDSIKEQSDSTD